MAFIAPFIGAALGLGSIGTAIVGAGVSLGLGLLARRIMPQPETTAYGMSLQLRMDPNDPREILFGRVATAGSLEAHNVYGPNGNDYVQLVFALGDHECDGLEEFIYVDGVKCNLGANVTTGPATGRAVDGYAGAMWVKFYSGAWGQSADADLIANVPAWTSNDRGRGICYVRVTMKFDATLYKGGLPRFLFIVRGAKLYDWRLDSTNGGTGAHRFNDPATWAWSANPAVILYNYLRGISVNGGRLGGMTVPSASLPVGAWTAAANACDEDVGRLAFDDEPRYRCHGIIRVGTAHRDVVRDILATMAGVLIDAGGVFRPIAGVAQSPVMSITDSDLMANDALQVVPKLSRSALVNAVFGTFSDPDQAYEAVALPPRLSPADEAADGGVHIPEHYGLGFVTSGTQGQRICEIFRRRARRQMRVSCRLRSRFCVLEPGDWVTWSSARLGYSSVVMEVGQVTLNRDLTVTVELRETAASVYAWTPGDDELDPADPAEVAAGGSTFDVVTGFAVTAIVWPSDVAGVERPGLAVAWDPVSDSTVIGIELQYRRVSETVAIERTIANTSTGIYRFADGIQGETQYEARLRLITNPVRATTWTGWVAAADVTTPQVVPVTVSEADILDALESLPPGSLGGLSEQERIELALVTARETVQGSVTARLEELRSDLERVAASSIGNTSLMTQQINAVRRSANGSAVTVSEVKEVTDGLVGRWAVVVDVDGRVVGAVELAGGPGISSSFRVLADSFSVSAPGETDSTPFVVIPGQGIFLDGVFVKDGSVTAEKISALVLSAITANLGTVTAGRIQNSDNSSFWDLNTGDFQIS
jgi:hypothetical protein